MQRDPSHQSGRDGGQLVPARIGPNVTQLPLLPYERSLIASVGMTPEEYEQYLRFISKKTGVRPEQITADAIIVPSRRIPGQIQFLTGPRKPNGMISRAFGSSTSFTQTGFNNRPMGVLAK